MEAEGRIPAEVAKWAFSSFVSSICSDTAPAEFVCGSACGAAFDLGEKLLVTA